eukprot:m.102360 g.102360  ORF g.102360 m.102360 type:complete len:1027 (-) comp13219_c1_seq8:3404-6484(-)
MSTKRDEGEDEYAFLLEDEDETAPFGANAENRKLDKAVKEAEKKLLRVESELESHKSRVTAMQNHLKNVQQEVQSTQALVGVRERERGNEGHVISMTSADEKRLQRDIQKIAQTMTQVVENINTNQNLAFKCKQQIEGIRADMKWNEGQLDTWMDQVKLVEEDAAVLEKYSRADEAKIKELTLRIERLTESRDKTQRDVEKEVMATQSQRIALDKAGEEYRRIHAEQQQTSAAWEKVIRQMEERDGEIADEAEQFQRLRDELAAKLALLREKEDFLKDQQKIVADAATEVAAAERLMLREREDLLRAQQTLQEIKDELASLRTTLAKTTQDLHSKKSEIQSLTKQITEREAKAAELESSIAQLQQDVDGARKKTLSAEEQEKQLGMLLEHDEKDLDAVIKEVAAMRQLQFRETERVHKLRADERVVEQSIAALRTSNKNAQSRITHLGDEVEQQEKVIYQQDFQLVKLERRLATLEGKQSKEEKAEFDKQITELKEQLEAQRKTSKLLTEQIRAVEDTMRVQRRRLDKDAGIKAQLTERLQRLELNNTGVASELKKLNAQLQEQLVEENMLKLEIRRVRQGLNDKADKVYTLEQRKQQLHDTMKQRLGEISIHKELLERKLREAELDKANIQKELTERRTRIAQLRKRYEIIVMTMDATEDGEVKTQAYYVVKHAQEREELQRQGDALDAKIRKGEKEIRALENTLHLMNGRNTKLKASLRQVTTTSREAEAKEALSTKYRTLMDTYKHKRRERREFEEELSVLEDAYAAVEAEERGIAGRVQQLQADAADVDRDLDRQEAKLQRATTMSRQLWEEHRAKVKGDDESLHEKDFRWRQLRETIGRVLRDVDAVVRDNPDIAIQLQMMYDRAGIKAAPSVPGSRMGSTIGSSSKASSVRSRAVSSKSTASASTRTMPLTAADAVAQYTASRAHVVVPTQLEFGLGITPSVPHTPSGSAHSSARAGGAARPSRPTSSASSTASSRRHRTSGSTLKGAPRSGAKKKGGSGSSMLSVSGSRPASVQSKARS